MPSARNFNLPKQKKNKKRTHRFERYHSDRYMRVHTSWRRPRGIDSAIRRKFRGYPSLPKVGYGTNRKFRYQNKNTGLVGFVVNNVSDLELLLMHNNKYAATIGASVSAKKTKRYC